MAEQFISPVVIEGRAWQVYATGVTVVAGHDCDVGDGGGVGQGKEESQNGEGEEGYPIDYFPFGFHSLARRWASASCWGVISVATASRIFTAFSPP